MKTIRTSPLTRGFSVVLRHLHSVCLIASINAAACRIFRPEDMSSGGRNSSALPADFSTSATGSGGDVFGAQALAASHGERLAESWGMPALTRRPYPERPDCWPWVPAAAAGNRKGPLPRMRTAAVFMSEDALSRPRINQRDQHDGQSERANYAKHHLVAVGPIHFCWSSRGLPQARGRAGRRPSAQPKNGDPIGQCCRGRHVPQRASAIRSAHGAFANAFSVTSAMPFSARRALRLTAPARLRARYGPVFVSTAGLRMRPLRLPSRLRPIDLRCSRHGRRSRVLHLDPMRRASCPVRPIPVFGDQSFQSHVACGVE